MGSVKKFLLIAAFAGFAGRAQHLTLKLAGPGEVKLIDGEADFGPEVYHKLMSQFQDFALGVRLGSGEVADQIKGLKDPLQLQAEMARLSSNRALNGAVTQLHLAGAPTREEIAAEIEAAGVKVKKEGDQIVYYVTKSDGARERTIDLLKIDSKSYERDGSFKVTEMTTTKENATPMDRQREYIAQTIIFRNLNDYLTEIGPDGVHGILGGPKFPEAKLGSFLQNAFSGEFDAKLGSRLASANPTELANITQDLLNESPEFAKERRSQLTPAIPRLQHTPFFPKPVNSNQVNGVVPFDETIFDEFGPL